MDAVDACPEAPVQHSRHGVQIHTQFSPFAFFVVTNATKARCECGITFPCNPSFASADGVPMLAHRQ